MVTAGGAGTFAGAVYKPEVEMDPQVAPEHPAPAMLHFTAAFVLPVTFAVNCCVEPALTEAVAGETETDTDVSDSMTTLAEADFVGEAAEVAVTVASAGLGTLAGAV
jgi:hypothetical protein